MRPHTKTNQLVKPRGDWYQKFIEDCQDIIVEHGFASRWALIEGYHCLGARILEENHNFERAKIYGEQVVKKVAATLGKGERSVEYAIKFAKKFPDLALLKEGKNVCWHDVCHKYLDAKTDKPQLEHDSLISCPSCGFKFKKEKR
jgi:hypothetical protein